jgi:hypothetical protein
MLMMMLQTKTTMIERVRESPLYPRAHLTQKMSEDRASSDSSSSKSVIKPKKTRKIRRLSAETDLAVEPDPTPDALRVLSETFTNDKLPTRDDSTPTLSKPKSARAVMLGSHRPARASEGAGQPERSKRPVIAAAHRLERHKTLPANFATANEAVDESSPDAAILKALEKRANRADEADGSTHKSSKSGKNSAPEDSDDAEESSGIGDSSSSSSDTSSSSHNDVATPPAVQRSPAVSVSMAALLSPKTKLATTGATVRMHSPSAARRFKPLKSVAFDVTNTADDHTVRSAKRGEQTVSVHESIVL